ncbi:hypothetical protein QLX08_011416 [Tetragonisca angustula]|uniref:Uncharacterized protein n=1 Tax=Tetragonisca angustula TaxID=166442 RepID=A0AAW0Z802_9HYME
MVFRGAARSPKRRKRRQGPVVSPQTRKYPCRPIDERRLEYSNNSTLRSTTFNNEHRRYRDTRRMEDVICSVMDRVKKHGEPDARSLERSDDATACYHSVNLGINARPPSRESVVHDDYERQTSRSLNMHRKNMLLPCNLIANDKSASLVVPK